MISKRNRIPTLYIMAKAPIMGRAKTRLARDIGGSRAIALNRLMTAKTMKAASEGIVSGQWQTLLAIDPPNALSANIRCWSLAKQRCTQSKGDLGARLNVIIANAPLGPVGIIGIDAPQFTSHHLRNAFKLLKSSDAVFGPADDGGFWFVGLNRRRALPSKLFKGVRWSTENALQDAVASLPIGYVTKYTTVLSDLDDANALGALTPLDLLLSR